MCGHNGKYQMLPDPIITTPLDCACVIHGTGYDWIYVERLYSMLCRHLSRPVNLHVYTEADRPVPSHMIKHALQDWGFGGLKKSWWYKLQLFNTEHHQGTLLYFDLDVVIANNIDWIWQLNQRHFWSIKDFKYLWKPSFTGSNTSVMWWDTMQYRHVWQAVVDQDIEFFVRKYRGDQDYISDAIPVAQRRFFHTQWVKSWRWQCLDGGFDFASRKYLTLGTGTVIDSDTSILVFHGNPKPHEITDLIIVNHWQ
jgi:hypothetical protein